VHSTLRTEHPSSADRADSAEIVDYLTDRIASHTDN